MERLKTWLLIAVLTICGTASFASCSSNEDNASEQSIITDIADKVWSFSQFHPDEILKRRGFASGFTATFPFEGNIGRILDRGDATSEEINGSAAPKSYQNRSSISLFGE